MNYRTVCKGGRGFSTDVNYRTVCKGGGGFSTDVNYRAVCKGENTNCYNSRVCCRPTLFASVDFVIMLVRLITTFENYHFPEMRVYNHTSGFTLVVVFIPLLLNDADGECTQFTCRTMLCFYILAFDCGL